MVPSVDCTAEGRPIDTFALNPFWTQAKEHGTGALDALMKRYLAPFGSPTRVDIARKLQNTERFLTAARAHTVEAMGYLEDSLAEESEGEDDA